MSADEVPWYHFFHTWTVWETVKVTYMKTTVRDKQSRVCKKCGLKQVRDFL